VPADADACFVFLGGRLSDSGSQPVGFTDLSWDDGGANDFTEVMVSAVNLNTLSFGSWYMLSGDANWPGSGSKTLYYTTDGVSYGESTLIVFFVKNIDSSDPIGNTDESTSGEADWASDSLSTKRPN